VKGSIGINRMAHGMSKYLRPDFSTAALITIDTQQDALDGQPFEIPGTSAILPNMVDLLQAFRKSGRFIVHVVRIYKQDGSNVDLCRRELIENGTELIGGITWMSVS